MRTMTPFNSSFQQMRMPVLRNTDAHTHVSSDGHGDKDDIPFFPDSTPQLQTQTFRGSGGLLGPFVCHLRKHFVLDRNISSWERPGYSNFGGTRMCEVTESDGQVKNLISKKRSCLHPRRLFCLLAGFTM